MKRQLYKYGCVGIIMLVFTLLSSCKDDNMAPSDGNGSGKVEIELPRINAFFDLSLPHHSGWEIKYHPEWAGPIKSKGVAGESLTFFAETNEEDEDRTDKITVALDNGTNVEFNIRQFGKLNDDSNGIITDDTQLKKTYGVGYGIDAFGTPIGASKYKVMPMSPFKLDHLISALSDAGESDGLFMDNSYNSRTESVIGSSTSSLANQLSINAAMEVGITAFKVAIDGGFSKNTSSNEEYSYAIEEIQHIVGTCYVNAGMLRYLAETGNTDIFQSSFLVFYNKMKENPTDKNTMKSIVDRYGTHIITQGVLGGELKLSMQMKLTEDLKSTDINAGLELGSKVINASGEFTMSNKEENIANNTTISLVTYGGDNVYSIAPGTTFVSFQEQVKDPEKISEWVSSIKNGSSLSLIDIRTIPIYELMPTQEAKDALREYIVGDYQKEVYSRQDENYQGPDLFKITGFDRVASFHGIDQAKVYIPEIELEIVAKIENIDAIDNTGSIVTIYSGAKDNVNYNSGFFIGNENHKPCKFKKKDNGSIEIEEFQLLENAAITELFVDATGNITISPRGIADYYREIVFVEELDLSQLSGSLILSNGLYNLTGTTNHEITVDGGEVVFNVNGNVEVNGRLKLTGTKAAFLVQNNSKFSCNTLDIYSNSTLDCKGEGEFAVRNDVYFHNYYIFFNNYCSTLNVNHMVAYTSEYEPYLGKCPYINIYRGLVNINTLALNFSTLFISKEVDHVYMDLRNVEDGVVNIEDSSKVTMTGQK